MLQLRQEILPHIIPRKCSEQARMSLEYLSQIDVWIYLINTAKTYYLFDSGRRDNSLLSPSDTEWLILVPNAVMRRDHYF